MDERQLADIKERLASNLLIADAMESNLLRHCALDGQALLSDVELLRAEITAWCGIGRAILGREPAMVESGWCALCGAVEYTEHADDCPLIRTRAALGESHT